MCSPAFSWGTEERAKGVEVGEAKQAPSTGTNTQLVPKSTPSKNQTLCLCPFIQCQEHKCLWPPFPQDRGWGGRTSSCPLDFLFLSTTAGHTHLLPPSPAFYSPRELCILLNKKSQPLRWHTCLLPTGQNQLGRNLTGSHHRSQWMIHPIPTSNGM